MNKQFRLPDGLAVALGLGLLLAAGLFAAFFPQPEFSDHERRYLSDAPSAPSLTSWETDDEIERYLSDRVPLRRVLVGVDASAHVLTGRRTQLETWPVAGAYVEKPVTGDEQTLERRLAQMAEVAQKAGAPWRVMVPPTHGWLLRDELSAPLRTLYQAEEAFYDLLSVQQENVPLTDVLAGIPDAYYLTDHHWTLEGAYAAYEAYCQSAGLAAQPLENYALSAFEGFQGTTFSRCGLLHAQADTLRCAEPAGQVRLTLLEDGTVHERFIFPERAETYDGYAVYLDGNHGMLEMINPDAPEGTLLVFKDSFANCVLPLLSANYRRIVAVDARYYGGSFSDAVSAAGETDEVLFLYSLDSLLNDTVVARKIAR